MYMKKQNIIKKSILFQVNNDLYDQIKKSCEHRGTSLRIFMTRAAQERLSKESKYSESEKTI